MATRYEVALNPRTVGAKGKPWHLWKWPTAAIHLFWVIRQIVSHPRISVTVAVFIFFMSKTHSLLWSLFLVFWIWFVICLCVIGWTRRGSAVGIRELRKQLLMEARFVKEWEKIAADVKFVNKENGKAPRIRKRKATAAGISGIVSIPRGRSPKNLKDSTDILASAFKCREFIVRDHSPGELYIEARYSDALFETVTLSSVGQAGKDTLTIGRTADGHLATVKRYLSILIVGMSGSGKSNVLWALIGSLIANQTPARLYVIDPAGGVELDYLERNLDPNATGYFAVHAYTNKASEAKVIIGHAHRAMSARLAAMKEKGVRFHIPTLSEPMRIVVIDEFLLLDMVKKGSDSELGEILTIGRKAGVVVWALSQAGTVDELGGARRLFPQRICLRTESAAQTNAVLGDRADSEGAHCSSIPESTPGVGYMYIDGKAGFQKFRGFYIPDDEAAILAQGKKPPTMAHLNTHAENLADQETHLYHFWNEAGQVIYIGISNNAVRRMLEEVADFPWISEVGRWAKVASYPNRAEALAAEKAAIQAAVEAGEPLYNKQHNKRRSKRTATV